MRSVDHSGNSQTCQEKSAPIKLPTNITSPRSTGQGRLWARALVLPLVFMAMVACAGGNTISTGQIASMPVPSGWELRTGYTLPAGAGLTEYHPHINDDIRLNSFYRGYRIDEESAQKFKECLAQPPHELQQSEIQGLRAVLDTKGYDFDLRSAKTVDLNGKKILWVEGAWQDAEHTNAQTIYVDSDGTGSAVQEISYSAPAKDYNTYLEEARKSLTSIQWKPLLSLDTPFVFPH